MGPDHAMLLCLLFHRMKKSELMRPIFFPLKTITIASAVNDRQRQVLPDQSQRSKVYMMAEQEGIGELNSSSTDKSVMRHLRENPYVLGLAAVCITLP